MTMNIEKILAAIPSMTSEKRGQLRENANEALVAGEGPKQEAARRLLDALDAQQTAEHDALVGELKELDTAARVIRAFNAEPMTETEAKLIQVLLDHPGSTSSALTAALGWKAQSWHLHFGTMCFNRSTYLWPAPLSERRDGAFYSGILADFDDAASTFTMKPDVAAAFAKLGLRPKRRA